MEWNLDTYDWHKNKFMEAAINCEAWAFASDYARLDVILNQGGIYLDMDVEVKKPFDDLLGNEVIFSFSNNTIIVLAVMGAVKNKEIIRKLIKIYDDVEIPSTKEQFNQFHQPSLIRTVLANNGIVMDGSMQKHGDITVFPSEFFMPLDQVLFDELVVTENTYCVHLDNFGWSTTVYNKREKKRVDNNILYSKLKN